MACNSTSFKSNYAVGADLVSPSSRRSKPNAPTSRVKVPASQNGSLFGKELQLVQRSHLARRRAASTARAAVSTSVPKTASTGSTGEPSWLDLHGAKNWEGLLPLLDAQGNVTKAIDPALKREVIKYGEMAQLTYDSVNLYPWSRYRDQNRYRDPASQSNDDSGDLFGRHDLEDVSCFEQLPKQDYKAVAYIYVREDTPVIDSLRKRIKGQKSEDDVWIGYIAYSREKKDLVVAWRGTQKPAEWLADAEVSLVPYKKYIQPDGHKAPIDLKNRRSPLSVLPPPIDKLIYGLLAFVGASGWGALSAALIGAPLSVIFLLLKGEGLLGVLFNGAFAFCAGLPVAKTFFNREGNEAINSALWYAGGVALFDALVNLLTPWEAFWSSNALIFVLAVLLPTGATAAKEAYESAGECPQVHEGFFELYTGIDCKTGKPDVPEKTSKKTAQQVVHDTLREYLKSKEHDIKTISVTGHSLGAAVAVLSAYDIVASGTNADANGNFLPVACFSFEGPRVGNPAFVNSFKDLHARGLAAIRIANKPDIVTEVPKAFYLQNVYYILAAITNLPDRVVDLINGVERLGYWLQLPSAFQHVAEGQSLVHDSREVDYLKKMTSSFPGLLNNTDCIGNYHNLEVNLHLVSGYWGGPSGTFDRDFALCNKSADVINERAGVRPEWFASMVEQLRLVKSEGGARIEPYSKWLDPPSGEDEKRKIGEGPVGKDGNCEPLVRNYFAKYVLPDPKGAAAGR